MQVARDETYQPDAVEDSTIRFYPLIDVTVRTLLKRFQWTRAVLVYSGNAGKKVRH